MYCKSENKNLQMRIELAKKIIEFEEECLKIGVDDYESPDTVEDMIALITQEPYKIFRWLEEKGIEYFDFLRLKGELK